MSKNHLIKACYIIIMEKGGCQDLEELRVITDISQRRHTLYVKESLNKSLFLPVLCEYLIIILVLAFEGLFSNLVSILQKVPVFLLDRGTP